MKVMSQDEMWYVMCRVCGNKFYIKKPAKEHDFILNECATCNTLRRVYVLEKGNQKVPRYYYLPSIKNLTNLLFTLVYFLVMLGIIVLGGGLAYFAYRAQYNFGGHIGLAAIAIALFLIIDKAYELKFG